MLVTKKNNKTEQFDFKKVMSAVGFAEERCGMKLTHDEWSRVSIQLKHMTIGREIVTVNELHKMVAHAVSKVAPKVAEEYERYHDYKVRHKNTFSRIIDETNDLLKEGDTENANKDSKLISTRKEIASGIISKHIALEYEIRPDIADAHRQGFLHLHDLTDFIYRSFNCCLFDMGSVLRNGFEINGIKKKEPQHITSAIGLVSDIIMSASSQQFGGFTVPELDSVLAPYVRKDYIYKYNEFAFCKSVFADEKEYEDYVWSKVYRDIYQGIEGIEHRLNTINNANGQTSFVTFTFGLDTTHEARLISKAILEVRMAGLGESKVSAIFPKLVFLHREDINGAEGTPNHDLKQQAIDCSLLRMYPDWLSLDAGYLGEMFDKYGLAVSPMGCRAYLSPWYKEDGTPVFIGRANFGAVTLNLPRIAITTRGDKDAFYRMVDEYMDKARDFQVYRFKKLSKEKASSNPLFFTQGGCHIKLNPDETIEKALRTFTTSIGYIGLEEVFRYWYGEGIEKHQDEAVEILQYLSDKIDEYKAETGLMFALYSTPAESLCYRFMKLDQKSFGVIQGVTDKEYYTNSFHVNVRTEINAIDKQKVEAPMFHIAKGGRIVYNEFPHTKNRKAVVQCIDHAMKTGLYYGVNLSLDICDSCGTNGEFHDGVCPNCGSDDVIVINRVCGYLSYTKIDKKTRLNDGKLEEVKDRVKHF